MYNTIGFLEVNMLIIRRIDTSKPKNIALLEYLQLEILPSDTPADTSIGYWWVAYDNNDPVAFCAMTHSGRWADTIYLSRAGVMEKNRGKGIQKKLIRVRERQAKKFGMNWLISDTYDNPASSNSLIRCGFNLYTPSKPYAANGTLYFRKKL